jgi:hypothetical protein
MPLHLPSKGFCLSGALGFAIERPLPTKGLCHQRAFAIEGLSPSMGLEFAFEGPFSITRESRTDDVAADGLFLVANHV